MPGKISPLVYIFVTLILFVGVDPSLAQSNGEPDIWMQPRQSRYDTMLEVKEEISRLIVENKELEDRYSQLKEQWAAMQQQGQLPGQVMRLPAQNLTPKQPVRKVTIMPNAVRHAGASIEAQPMANTFVKGELMDYDESLGLLELRLADLRYQRRELELELKLQQVAQQDKVRSHQLKESRLQNELQSGLLEERRLMQMIQRREKEAAEAPMNIPQLKKENQILALEIPALQQKIEVKKREIGLLQSQMDLKEKASSPVLSSIEKEKAILEAYVTQLSGQYESLSATVSTSLRRQERKEQLIRDIIDFDKENQKLQRQIEELTDKIRYHTY